MREVLTATRLLRSRTNRSGESLSSPEGTGNLRFLICPPLAIVGITKP